MMHILQNQQISDSFILSITSDNFTETIFQDLK